PDEQQQRRPDRLEMGQRENDGGDAEDDPAVPRTALHGAPQQTAEQDLLADRREQPHVEEYQNGQRDRHTLAGDNLPDAPARVGLAHQVGPQRAKRNDEDQSREPAAHTDADVAPPETQPQVDHWAVSSDLGGDQPDHGGDQRRDTEDRDQHRAGQASDVAGNV